MSPKRVSGKRNSLQRVPPEVRWPAAEPAQLAIELAPPDAYLRAAAIPHTPSWRQDHDHAMDSGSGRQAAGGPVVVSVIELDIESISN